MKKFLLLILPAFLVYPNITFSAGTTVHMFMADEAIKHIKNDDLRKLLTEEKRAYLNGAVFPDTGYIGNRTYGEYSHWSDFHNEYLTLIKNKCEFPFKGQQCRSLVAHFLGCIAHTLGDINWDRYFQRQAADLDFNGDYQLADKETTFGMDLIAIMKYKRGRVVPKTWYPKEELTDLYKRKFGKDLQIEMKKSTRIHKLLQIGERFIAPIGAMVKRKKAPWATANLINGKGGIEDTAKIISAIYDKVWDELVQNGFNGKIYFHHNGGWPNNNYWVNTSVN